MLLLFIENNFKLFSILFKIGVLNEKRCKKRWSQKLTNLMSMMELIMESIMELIMELIMESPIIGVNHYWS